MMFRLHDKTVARFTFAALATTAWLASGLYAGAQSTDEASAQVATLDTLQRGELRPCLDPRASTDRDIAAYLAGPKNFFDRAIAREALLSIPSRNIVIQRPSLSESLVEVAGVYGFETKPGREILAGLGQAALICVNRASNAAVYIQEQIALTGNRGAIDAFRAVTGDNRPAAIAGSAAQPVNVGRTAQSVSTGSALPIQIERQPARTNRSPIERSPAGTVQTTVSYTFAASSLFFEVDDSDNTNTATSSTVAVPSFEVDDSDNTNTAASATVAVPSVASPTQ